MSTESNPPGELPNSLSEIGLRHLESARSYLRTLLDDLTEDDWYWLPPQGISCIAWQVGHLAMAEYGLLLFRQRGRQSIDSELMSGAFRKRFAKGSTPPQEREQYPSREEILATLDAVHSQALKEVPAYSNDELSEPVDQPHAAYATRFGALLFAGDHEMLHAGQIGMLRRLMGKDPVR